MTNTNQKVYIIILNWNGLRDTIECLESVKKIDYPNYEIIVVDNGSTDGSPEEIARLFPEITLIRNKENLGYAEGNNVGIRYALRNSTDYILLLNNDTIVDPKILKSFVEAADMYPEAGIFGAKIYYYSDPNRIWYAGGKWDENRLHFFHIGEGEQDNDDKYNRIRETDYVCGCALFFRKTVVQTIGLLESRFFLVYEDNDWCYRARKAGFKSLFIPDARLWHKCATSLTRCGTPLITYFNIRNLLFWAQRNLPFLQRWFVYYLTIPKVFFPCVFKSKNYPLIKRIYWDIFNIIRDKPQFKAKIFGLRDFVFRRFGNCPKSIWQLNRCLQK